MTAQDLLNCLLTIDPVDREHIEVRVVFHGYEEKSFNLPALYASGPDISDNLNIVCEERR